jgi:hypothetical protein
MISWSDPLALSQYRTTFRQPGIYIIGGKRDETLGVTGSGTTDPYMQTNWPTNFIPYYVGISESYNTGVRGRLRAHRRRKGNKSIARRIRDGESLYFIAAHGDDLAVFEAFFLCLKRGNQFGDNVRCETDRNAKRLGRKNRAAMNESERDFFDDSDFDGRGLG